MKKGDKILIVCISSFLMISFIVWFFLSGNVGTKVVVSQNNEIVYQTSLFENNTIKLKGNTVEIKNGKVLVSWADCKNQICVNHKEISKKGESIICLPNKVIVEIK